MSEKEILNRFLPDKAVDLVFEHIKSKQVFLKISKSRKTKLGDYRPPVRHSHHRITVNHDLNKYSFLITLVHELAHLEVFEAYGNKVAPHGSEWKTTYKQLMQPFLQNGSFPDDINRVLVRSLINSKASSTSDIELSRVLKFYDKPSHEIHVEDLSEGAIFQMANGKQFRKGERIRTRFKCQNLQNKRFYLFHPLTQVSPIEA